MRTRFTIVAILALAAIGFLMACSTKYSAGNNGLVVVPSQGSLVMESFSLDLANGHVSEINNVNGPYTSGIPSSVILDSAGSFAYVIVYQNPAAPGSSTGIASFQVASDGKLATANVTGLNSTSPTVTVACVTPSGTTNISVGVLATPVVPVAMAIDSAGKYLFVADAATTGETLPYQCNGATVSSSVGVPGTVSVFGIGNGAPTEIAGSPFGLPAPSTVGSGTIGSAANASALAVTRTAYPTQYSACSLNTPPTTENLYVTDSVNDVLLNYSVNTSTGALTPVLLLDGESGIAAGGAPSGVAVDPCNRFVFVANATSNSVSAYTICNAISIPTNCQYADFSLQTVTGSPFAISPGDAPGPISVDAYGNSLFVVDTASNEVSGFHISPSNGSLTLSGTYPAGTGANSIAVRGDDSWVFVANNIAGTVSQYTITPATGVLSPQGSFSTLNNPTGVAVK